MDERQSSLTVQTGIVEAVGEDVDWIQKGDIALQLRCLQFCGKIFMERWG